MGEVFDFRLCVAFLVKYGSAVEFDEQIAFDNLASIGDEFGEGDQTFPGMPILRIFNPSKMVVTTTINEPDISSVKKDTRARLFLDAYPNAVFDARLETASPVATAGMDSPVRTFTAVFRIEQQNPLLLPDLSAALEIERQGRVK